MTDATILADYMRIEREQAKTQRGQDPSGIIDALVEKYDRPRAQIVRVVLDGTFTDPN